MKFTKVHDTIQRSLALIGNRHPIIQSIVNSLHAVSARVYLAGGAVRDTLLEKPFKDIDIEVYGISAQELEKFLSKFGHVRTVGKAFGVFRIDGLDVDWSLPRTDSAGRHPKVTTNAFLSITEACKRRDLTMNAMLIDMHTGHLEDPFNGLQDLHDKVLRTPDPYFFVQDPLRFYRILQFMGRFEMQPDDKLSQVCATMDIRGVSQERIFVEYDKFFLLSKKPSIAFKWLVQIGRLQEILPELFAIRGVEQNPVYHPEGDVFEHTMQALDGAAALTYATNEQRLVMMYTALCHDLGKATTTRVIEGVIRSHGHDVAGGPLAARLLDRLTGTKKYKKPVVELVRCHMMPVSMVKNNAGPAAYKRLAARLAPESSLRVLHQLAYIDKSARNPDYSGPLPECPEPLLQNFFELAQKYGVLDVAESPLLTGSDFIQEMEEGPEIGALVQCAYDLQIEEGIHDKNELKQRVLSRCKKGN